jgi:hypothetical protein
VVCELRYHRATFELLGIDVPPVSDQSVRAIATLEQSIEAPLPEALREWYSLEGAARLLRKFEILDEPAQLDLPGRPLAPGLLGLTEEGFLYLGCSEQAVCEYAVELYGSDDPPVLIFCGEVHLGWRKAYERFSQFVHLTAALCRYPRRDEEC